MKRLSQLVVLTALLGARVALAAEEPVGKWQTVNEKTGKAVSDVQLSEQRDKLSGTCTACKGADKDQPNAGLVIIKVWGEDGKLTVRGSLGPFYKTQTWNKGD